MNHKERLLAALDIIGTVPAFRDEKKILRRGDLFDQAVEEALRPGDEGKAVRSKLYELLEISVNGMAARSAVIALGKVLARAEDQALKQEIIPELVHAARTRPGLSPAVAEIVTDLAARAPDEWYGGLSQTFARAVLQDGREAWLGKVYEKIWKDVGARKLDEVWPQRAP